MTTPAASVAIKKPKSKSNPLDGSTYKRCMCSWKKPDTWPVTADLETQLPWCEYLLQTVAQHADSDDVWHGVPFRFVAKDDIKQSSEKMIALRISVQQHVPGFEDKSNQPNFIIARHHFPRALLECRPAWNIKIGTTFLSKEQAQLIAEKDRFGSRRFIENCNQVSKLLAKAGEFLQTLQMGISSFRRHWLRKSKSRIL